MCLAIDMYPREFRVWNMLAFEDVKRKHCESLIPEGTAIMRFQNRAIGRICDKAWLMKVCGVEVWVANTPVMQSETCEELLKRDIKRPFAACYFVKEGKFRQWSLRSRTNESVNVGAICKAR